MHDPSCFGNFFTSMPFRSLLDEGGSRESVFGSEDPVCVIGCDSNGDAKAVGPPARD